MIIYRNKTGFENQKILPRNPFATQFGAISERGHFLKVLSWPRRVEETCRKRAQISMVNSADLSNTREINSRNAFEFFGAHI